MSEILNKINNAVWGTPTLLLIFFTGVILTVRTNFFQIRFFGKAFKNFFKKSDTENEKNLTPIQSVSTALSATMGTGNIVGVAGAVALGGPGAVFWMWVSAFFCMIIKFSEIALSVRYRETNKNGTYSGGVMYYIKNALPDFYSPIASVFCVLGVLAAFGVGNMTQINTMSASISSMFKTVTTLTPKCDFFVKLSVGILCALVCALVLKNDKSIGKFCQITMPLMTLTYIVLTLGAIAVNYKSVPNAFLKIFIGAKNPQSVTGGAIGSAFCGMRYGMSRGVFSNEAGLGTAPCAYACGDGDEISLGFMGIMEVFIDTVVVCTLTALTLLCVGDITYGSDTASMLTLNALSSVYGEKVIFVFCPLVCVFAFSSVIGWGLYGTKFITFLAGEGAKNVFLIFFVFAMIPASVFEADIVWVVAEILNGLMSMPNIVTLLLLNGDICEITHKYSTAQKSKIKHNYCKKTTLHKTF